MNGGMVPQNEVIVLPVQSKVQGHPEAMPQYHPSHIFVTLLPEETKMGELHFYPYDSPIYLCTIIIIYQFNSFYIYK